jgi:hypothetical protein
VSTLSGGDPYAAAVTRLLDLARQRGFTFTPAGQNGSSWGERVSAQWRDVVFLGASGHGNAARVSTGVLVPGESLFAERVSGSALTVLAKCAYTPSNRYVNPWITSLFSTTDHVGHQCAQLDR